MRDKKKFIQSFVKKTLKVLLGRYRHRWEDSNNVYLDEIGWEGVHSLYMCQI
jgi:hypothetical protein